MDYLTDEDKAEYQAWLKAKREAKRFKQFLLEYKWYVYELLDEGVPFYVGKGSGMRIFMHERDVRRKLKGLLVYREYALSSDKERKIAYILCYGGKIGYRIVLRTNDEREALVAERCHTYRNRRTLLNVRIMRSKIDKVRTVRR